MARPVRHRLNHKPVLVLDDDDAIDQERLGKELLEIEINPEESPWKTKSEHPYIRYIEGSSRYDLATIAEYIDEKKKPVKFHMRRLGLNEYLELQQLFAREHALFFAYAHAIKHGLDSVENFDFELERAKYSSALTDQCVDDLRLELGEGAWISLARAIVAVSAAMTPEEKKL